VVGAVVDTGRVMTRFATFVGLGFFRVIVWALPKDRRAAAVVGFVFVWAFWSAFVFLTSTFRTAAGDIPNHAHGHIADSVGTGLVYALICVACVALVLYLRSHQADR
jgi:hypothetical protein